MTDQQMIDAINDGVTETGALRSLMLILLAQALPSMQTAKLQAICTALSIDYTTPPTPSS